MMRAESVSSSAPSVQDLEDVLYDILATGVDPTAAPGTLQAVQVFVHEHARSPKGQADMLAFFAQHGLPLQRPADSVVPPSFALPSLDLPDIEPAPDAMSGMSVDGTQLPARSSLRPQRSSLRLALVVCALVLASAGIGAGYGVIRGLRDELAAVRNQSAEQSEQLATVSAEARTLRVTLDETATLAERANQKSELLLQTYASPLDVR